MPKRKKVEEIPKEFKTYEEAGEFWDTHDSMDYEDILEEAEFEVSFQKRHYLLEIKEETAKMLQRISREKGISTSEFIEEILQKAM